MIKAKDGTPLFTESWRVDDPRAVVVLTHGHGEYANRYLHVGRAFTAAGYSTYAYDLRGHGRSGGPRGHAPGYEAILDDLQSIIDWARAENPGRRMFLYGHSTGGQI
ncbi:MAG: alpha/beta fold hydrolase, partial [Chloroflexi bacterium]|nr:alpha/beta fold hydrolase [Chloroflexota bacterium]